VSAGATIRPEGLMIEPFGCTIEFAGMNRVVVDKIPRIGIGGTALAGIIVPDVVVLLPATGFGIVFAGATKIPVALITEPSSCTIEFAGIDARTDVEIRPRIGIGGIELAGIMLPVSVTMEPATAGLTVFLGATGIPEALSIEPSNCTIEPAGIDAIIDVEIVPSVT
jgi:hypothetical protein